MKFETYVDAKGEHRWRARASNGKIVADGAEGYASKRNVDRALARFLDSMRPQPQSEIKVTNHVQIRAEHSPFDSDPAITRSPVGF